MTGEFLFDQPLVTGAPVSYVSCQTKAIPLSYCTGSHSSISPYALSALFFKPAIKRCLIYSLSRKGSICIRTKEFPSEFFNEENVDEGYKI